MMRLLLVEDDKLLGDGIRVGLIQDGYVVDWVNDGLAADNALRCENFDAVVLDINLPKINGLEVLKRLRERQGKTPVLLLTARDAVSDRVEGLDSGADDYLTKPFDLDELSARLRALIRRSGGQAAPKFSNGELMLDPVSHTVTRAGELVELTKREFSLLHMLIENLGKVLSRSRLEESLYGWGGDVGSNTLEVHIHNLRKKVGSEYIKTVRGVGYIMEKM